MNTPVQSTGVQSPTPFLGNETFIGTLPVSGKIEVKFTEKVPGSFQGNRVIGPHFKISLRLVDDQGKTDARDFNGRVLRVLDVEMGSYMDVTIGPGNKVDTSWIDEPGAYYPGTQYPYLVYFLSPPGAVPMMEIGTCSAPVQNLLSCFSESQIKEWFLLTAVEGSNLLLSAHAYTVTDLVGNNNPSVLLAKDKVSNFSIPADEPIRLNSTLRYNSNITPLLSDDPDDD